MPPPGLSLKQNNIVFDSDRDRDIAAEQDDLTADLIYRLQAKVNKQKEKIDELERERLAGIEVHEMMAFHMSGYYYREKRLVFEHPALWKYEDRCKPLTFEDYEKFQLLDQKYKNMQDHDPHFMSKFAKAMMLPGSGLLVSEKDVPR